MSQAVSHSHGGDKDLVRLVFRPAEGAELEPEFGVIIVRQGPILCYICYIQGKFGRFIENIRFANLN